jgi:hypothetical protein
VSAPLAPGGELEERIVEQHVSLDGIVHHAEWKRGRAVGGGGQGRRETGGGGEGRRRRARG